MAFDGGNLFYALVGGGDNKFYRYNSTSDSWTQLSQIPKNLQIFPPPPDNYSLSVDTGSDLVYTGPWNNDLYALVVGDPRGRPSTPEADFLYRYSISSNSWELAAKTPGELGAGASLEYDGGSSLYVFQGESSTLWKYSTSGWEFLEPLPFPGTVGAGGTLVYNGNNYLYALLGGGSNEFWRYDINANDWTELSTLPSSVNSGGSLAYNGDDDIYALPGGSNEVWQYTISTNTWSLLSTTPAGRDIGSGGDIVLINSEKGYVLRGGNNREFWKFTAAPPLYDILSQAGDLEIYARVELVGSSSTITFWKID
jgi:N-acetylneuraminic acid mutarotase